MENTSTQKFIQTAEINDLLGDVVREYEEIEEKLIYSKSFQK